DNDAIRECDLYVVEGIPSATPVHPDLTRSGSIYEIGLADIFVGHGAVRILADKITDTRYDNSRCGVMSSISEFDTTTLNQQMNAWSESAREEFRQWLQEIHGILDENAAGHLQNEIDELSGSVSQQIDEINQHLTANNKKYMADYVDGEYGFTINGTFYPFSGGTTYLGEYSADTTIDISELKGNLKASDFIFVINEDDKISNKTSNYQDYATGYTIFYPASISISGSTLSLTLPREYINNNGATDSKLLKGKLYYKPSAVIGIYTENKTIDVSAYNPITVNQFVAMEIEQTQTAKGSYTTQQNWGGFTATYKKAVLSLSGKTLTVNAPTTDGLNKKSNIKYKLCYLGKALKFSKQGF
ncbi:MAG: hypothetical protein K6A05_09005, partial [Lachnospiraceae bacterium]|nr:hypothetical protein [Lachnospiraceae bacterium]